MKQWYVIQLMLGQEDKVKKEILKRAHERGLVDYFGEIVVPQAKTVNSHTAGNDQSVEDLFPGYMLINMESDPLCFRLVYTVNGVVRFLGDELPTPLPEQEVSHIMQQIKGEIKIERSANIFSVGNEISISSGPFTGFSGIINKIDEEKRKLVVMISIFGRSTPIEVLFDHVVMTQ